MIAIIEWNVMVPTDKTWPKTILYFAKAYEAHLDSILAEAGTGYHGAVVGVSNNNSLGLIVGSIFKMKMANNANAKVMPDGMSTIMKPTYELWQALMATG